MTATQVDIQQAIHKSNLSGQPVCVHASLRSFGHVTGGAAAVVNAFANEKCTLLVPSFSWTFAVAPPTNERPRRNGWDYKTNFGSYAEPDKIYSSATQEVDRDMGAIPAAVVASPERMRGKHPLCSFSALGPLAQELISGQSYTDVCAPLSALAQLKGYILLIGVGLDSMTLLHLAEKQAGRALFQRWANQGIGYPEMAEVGGCSDGFAQFEPYLAHLERQVIVGQSRWRIYPAQKVLEAAIATIQRLPEITHCKNTQCERCNDAMAGGPY